MTETKTMLLLLAVGLSVLGAAMFWAIAWLRRSSTRYRFFELFICLFLLGFGIFVLWNSPSDPMLAVKFVGVAGVVVGLVNLPLALSQFRRGAIRCSFCGKGQRFVRKLIAGPAAHICDECVAICNETLAQE